MNKRTLIFNNCYVLAVIGSLVILQKGENLVFTTLLPHVSMKKAKFFGAFCVLIVQNKRNFLESADKLPYVECSTPDERTNSNMY